MRPLMLFGVLYFVFTEAIKIGATADYFPAVLLTNIVLFTFFSEATTGAVTSVMDRENLVRKIHFPRLVVPAAVVLTATFNLALNMLAVGIFIFASGVPVRATWLFFPVLLLSIVALAAGIAMLVSALYVRLRDIKPIWDVLTQVLFYATPIIYVIETVKVQWVREAMMLNPLGTIMQQTRHWMIDPDALSASQAAGSKALLLIPVGITVGLLVVGYWVFDRQAPRIAEDL